MKILINALNVLLSPLLILKPHLVILILASALTITGTVFKTLFIGKRRIIEMKKEIAKIMDKINLAQKSGDQKIMQKYMNELFKLQRTYFKMNLIPILFSLSLFLIFAPWFQASFSAESVVVLPISIPIIGKSINWIIWYIMISICVAWLIEKLFGE